MTELSLEEQVRTLQAQLAVANARTAYLESEVVHPSEAYSGTEMIQALLTPVHKDLTGGQLKELTGFLTLFRQHKSINALQLQTCASNLLDNFYTAEPLLSGKS